MGVQRQGIPVLKGHISQKLVVIQNHSGYFREQGDPKNHDMGWRSEGRAKRFLSHIAKAVTRGPTL